LASVIFISENHAEIYICNIAEMQIKDAYEKIAQCKSELNAAKCVRHNRQGNLRLHWPLIAVELVLFIVSTLLFEQH